MVNPPYPTQIDTLYVDFASGQPEVFYEQPRDWALVSLLTYDAEYIYLITHRTVGFDEEDRQVGENYLQRIPRNGGALEKVYHCLQPSLSFAK